MSDDLLVVYQAHPLTGEFIGTAYADPDPMEPGNWLIPGRAVTEAPPEVEPGFAAIHVPGVEPAWSVIEDLRGEVYDTATGTAHQWVNLGPLLDGFTTTPKPSPSHAWNGKRWAIDSDVELANQRTQERQWRDAEIERVQWLRERHRDEADLEREHTLNLEQFKQLLSYLQALRDWPQSPDFPAREQRPIQPDWIAEQTR